ncbi:MAG: hypothetical protein K5928_01215 [Prevotella sp.]|nr:hypothetical protein [Prevotella sp.]
MKKKLCLCLACLWAAHALGQKADEQELLKNVDWKEDSTEITTINDIVKTQQDLTSRRHNEQHFRNVWSRKGYVNLSYNTTAMLTPEQVIPTGLDDGTVGDFKSNWGASLQVGHSYAMHKKPIANMVQINLDFSFIDLNVNHFSSESTDRKLYDSNTLWKDNDKEYFYTPWNLEKYDFNYGMALGPSLCVAPFTKINSPQLHHLKLNFFFHVGYHVSFLYFRNNSDADANTTQTKLTYEERTAAQRREKMEDNLKLDLGHGLTTSFGLSLTWKVIGVGYEWRSAKLKYKSLSTNDFGNETYKFKANTNRVFIQFRI